MIPMTRYKVLDIGCGDGYVARELFKNNRPQEITCVDTHLTREQIRELSMIDDHIRYFNETPSDAERSCNLVLLLDVIEHIDDDLAFLRRIVGQVAAENGYVLITVPAFPWLFSAHDAFLGHYRRYYLNDVIHMAESSGLLCLASGYLFASLLIPRSISLCFQRIFKSSPASQAGAGDWNFNEAITKPIELWLRADNFVCLQLRKIGIRVPGLTAWLLCMKPRPKE
jgi:SAM-dependent methyltransferase